jgi:hypothetical protein
VVRLTCSISSSVQTARVLASPLREQGPSNRVRYETPSGVITGPSLSRVIPSLQRAILSLQLTDKKNKRIESGEIRDSDSGSSLEAYIEGIFISFMEQMGIFGLQERSLIEKIA